MRSPARLPFFLAQLAALLLTGSMTARSFAASITQTAKVSYTSGNTNLTDEHTVDDGGTGVITQDILSKLSSVGSYDGIASVGRFGEVGLSGINLSRNSRLEVSVDITNDERAVGAAQGTVLVMSPK